MIWNMQKWLALKFRIAHLEHDDSPNNLGLLFSEKHMGSLITDESETKVDQMQSPTGKTYKIGTTPCVRQAICSYLFTSATVLITD